MKSNLQIIFPNGDKDDVREDISENSMAIDSISKKEEELEPELHETVLI